RWARAPFEPLATGPVNVLHAVPRADAVLPDLDFPPVRVPVFQVERVRAVRRAGRHDLLDPERVLDLFRRRVQTVDGHLVRPEHEAVVVGATLRHELVPNLHHDHVDAAIAAAVRERGATAPDLEPQV